MKVIASILFLLLIMLQMSLWFGDYGLLRLWGLQNTLENQKVENEQLTARNETLHAEVIELKEGKEALEERARSQLGMIKEGEIFYRLIPKQADKGSASHEVNEQPVIE